MTAAARFAALGSTAEVVVTDPHVLVTARRIATDELDALDRACSRFRPDSEITALHEAAGRPMSLSPLLAAALRVALRAAALTDGLVDPTVGTAVRTLGYDRDFASLAATGTPVLPTRPAPGWHRVLFDPDTATVVLPRGVTLDLGASAKAFAADRIAAAVADRTGAGVLISLGGDLAVAGPPPQGGWRVGVGDDHSTSATRPAAAATLTGGGFATSGITRRRWKRGDGWAHHIVDPRTGANPAPCWRTVSVAAASCVDANTASTAAIVLGTDAPAWLAARGLPARLVALDGTVHLVPTPENPATADVADTARPRTAA